MNWIVYLIPIVAIVGYYYLNYRKQELKFMEKTAGRSNEINELKNTIELLTKRIQVLESIAASEQELNDSKSGPIFDHENLDETEGNPNANSDKNRERKRE